MHSIFKLLCSGLLISVLAVQCKTNPASDKPNIDTTNIQSKKNLSVTEYDTVSELFNCKNELMTEDLIALKIIDTTLTTQLSETCYCDTTIELNDSIYYSVIHVNDEAGLCTYFFVASLDKQNKNVIASNYLHPDCDVDYSMDTYELHEHAIISKDKIEVINTTIFQKKDRTSPDEEQNIDHKKIEKSYFIITQTGQISNTK